MPRSRFRPSGRTEVARLRGQLGKLFERADREATPGTDLEGDLNRYLVVRVSGYLEQAVMSCCRALAEAEARGRALAHSLSWLEQPPNPRADRLLTLVGRFSAEWRDELDEFLEAEERKGRVNALIGIRNDVAHGRNQGVSRLQVYEYYELANELVDWFLERFDPLP